MANPLASTMHKFNRAHFHLGELRALVQSQRDSIRIDADLDTDAPHYRLTLSGVPPVPVDMSVVLGDCIHNFRSSLDHLMNGLAVMNGKKRSKKTVFPILRTPGWDGSDKADARRALKTIAMRHQGIIKAAQPHHGWNGPGRHPIEELHDLDIIDKHRDFNTTVVMPIGTEFNIVEQVDCEVVEVIPMGLGRRLEPGAVIGQIRINATGPNPQVSMEAVFTPTIEFEDGREIIGAMEAIGNYIFSALLSPVMPGATLEMVLEEDDSA